MERIKDALEEARKLREKALLENTLNSLLSTSSADVNDMIDARRIRDRIPINQMPEDEQQALIASGDVSRVDSGGRVFVIGQHDEYVHYLLEGAVRIEGENTPPQTLYAYQEAALLPLDEAGSKTHTVTAVIPSRVFRIAQTRLQGEVPPMKITAPAATTNAPPPNPMPPPIPSLPNDEAISPDLYTHTYSGQELAQLVDALHADRQALAETSAAQAAGALPEVRFGEQTLGVRLAPFVPEIDKSIAEAPAPAADLPSHDEISDEISRFTRELEVRFRHYVETVRAQERQRAQAQLQLHVKRLKQLAEQQLRVKVDTIRERYQAAHLTKEKKLRERYENLIVMANKMTRQKAAIYQARRQLEDKLRMAEQVHNELAQIGLTVTRQLNDLEGMIPDDENTGT
jgi:hypothetical protein